MKKLLLLFAISGFVLYSAFSQNVVPHFTDASKKIVIPKEATVFSEIHEGLIAIYHDGKIYYVKTNGEYLFGSNFPFTRCNDFYYTAYFSGGAMMGCRQKDYSSKHFIVYPDGKYREFPTGLKNSSGLSIDVSAASSFCEGYALVRKGDLWGSVSFIDKNGKDVFPQLTSKGTSGYEFKVHPLREGRRLYFDFDKKKYGYADEKGNIVIKPQFDNAENFNDGMALVMIKEGYNEKWGYIDLTGTLVIPATYKIKPGRFSEGLAVVRIGEADYDCEMAYIDKTGKRVMDRQPWILNEFHDGYAWVKKNNPSKMVVINKNFEEVRDVMEDPYMFQMSTNHLDPWGFDFPGGSCALRESGVGEGVIYAPDGTVLLKAVDARGNNVWLKNRTEGDLYFCSVRFRDEPRLKSNDIYLPCFINDKGEVVYYFVEDFEGYEGITPVQVK
jgi:hypothetical protein